MFLSNGAIFLVMLAFLGMGVGALIAPHNSSTGLHSFRSHSLQGQNHAKNETSLRKVLYRHPSKRCGLHLFV